MPSGLVSTRRSPTTALRVAENALRMHASGDREAELQLLVDDAVAADDDRARLVHLVLTAAQDLGEHLERQLARRKADDVQRRERLAAHRVDVGQRVRRGDLAERDTDRRRSARRSRPSARARDRRTGRRRRRRRTSRVRRAGADRARPGSCSSARDRSPAPSLAAQPAQRANAVSLNESSRVIVLMSASNDHE